MKYDNTIDLLKIFVNAMIDPTSVTKNLRKSSTLKYPRGIESNNSIYAESEDSNEEYNESSNKQYNDNETIPMEDNKSYNDNNKDNNYYNKKEDTSLSQKGVIDSIAQELTPVRLQQAIILSEIVGRPRSKTRRKRRF